MANIAFVMRKMSGLVGIDDHVFKLPGRMFLERWDETTYLNTGTNYLRQSEVEAVRVSLGGRCKVQSTNRKERSNKQRVKIGIDCR